MRPLILRRALALAAVTTAVTATAGLATAMPAHAATSKVSVVHGIPDTPVDVYVNGKVTLKGFKPGDVAGPLELAEGKYDIDLTKPGEPIDKAILSVDDAAVPGGANISIVAHLDAAGKPKITPFVNDVSKVGAGKARLIVRHTAAAPAVDVRAGGTPVFQNLTNPNEAKADLAAGTVSADVVLAGTTTVAIPATDVDLKEGTATIVYATGSADGKNLGVVAQVITGLHSAPGGVPSGDGGLADEPGAGVWWLVAAAAAMMLAVAGGVRFATRRTGR
ncbi:DUF4397 domain-containing protein [Catellatospora sp. KI3]|uniref:DUF4397 domain-containing protein n=1 Tax=Catellatospora sp. KI3 TaxID=3041620 RepID=UPI0024821121|nr:DUF4397 domain-containing protein [Catellatospora sp. KI3]MDI1463446.1 DUF4397 domain-containing protein [Catellatospora sp. KI3]